jgi:hypothetical protein
MMQKNTVVLLILVVLATFVSADITVLNTPPTLITGQIYQITWGYTGPANGQGQLIITDAASGTPKLISGAVPLQPNSLAWTVDVNPGKYYFTLTESGSASTKTSGTFQIVAGGGATPPGANTTVAAPPVSTGASTATGTTSATTTTSTSSSTKPTAPAGSGNSAPAGPPNDGSQLASSIFITVLLPLVFALAQMI